MGFAKVANDVSHIANDLQHHTPAEQAHLVQGIFMEVGREALHEFNGALKSMGVQTPMLDQMEKNLTQQEMQEFFDAHLNSQDVTDLFNLYNDTH